MCLSGMNMTSHQGIILPVIRLSAAPAFYTESLSGSAKEGSKDYIDETVVACKTIGINWEACIDETLKILEPMKIFPVIDKEYKAILAINQIVFIEQQIKKVQMFNLSTCKLMPIKDDKPDLTQIDCIPFHVMILIVMLMGINKSHRILLETLSHWKSTKAAVYDGIDDGETVNKIMIDPVTKHALQAHQKYNQLLAYNLSSKGMCCGKAEMINSWMVALKNEVESAKMVYELKQVNLAMHNEITQSKTISRERDEEIRNLKEKLAERDEEVRKLKEKLAICE